MGPTQINGLPAHVLLIHVVVVMLPLACLALVLSTWWPTARRRLGIVTPILALIALIAVPITTHAGEWLRDRLPNNPLIARHAHLGGQLLPWAIALFVVALAHWVWSRFVLRTVQTSSRSLSAATDTPGGVTTAVRTTTAPATTSTTTKVVTVVFAVVALALAVVNIWMVYRIGDSGAQAVWQGT